MRTVRRLSATRRIFELSKAIEKEAQQELELQELEKPTKPRKEIPEKQKR